MITTAIANRSTSSFPISIGTALALESVFDPRTPRYDDTREIPPRVDLTNYQEIHINLFTLFRNLLGAMDKEAVGSAKAEDLCDALLFEIEIINSLFAVEGAGLCKPIFYTCSYEHLFKHAHRTVLFRTDKTELQIATKNKMLQCMDKLHRLTDSIVKFDSDLKPRTKSNSLLMSHMTWDLVSRQHFLKLDLLESHTGLLKDRTKWYTKYFAMPNEDMSCIPFMKKLLYVFGDKVMITPMDRKLRALIMETAKKRGWTQMTTVDKVMLDLGIDIKEPYVLDVLRQL